MSKTVMYVDYGRLGTLVEICVVDSGARFYRELNGDGVNIESEIIQMAKEAKVDEIHVECGSIGAFLYESLGYHLRDENIYFYKFKYIRQRIVE